MGPDFAKPYMAQLQKFLQQEWAGREAIFPPQALIFRAYNAVPLDKIKVRHVAANHRPASASTPLPGRDSHKFHIYHKL